MKIQERNAIGCRAVILPREIFCEAHLWWLHADTRRELERTFRPGERPSQVFRDALDVARNEILYAQKEGHREPRPAALNFDDDYGRRI